MQKQKQKHDDDVRRREHQKKKTMKKKMKVKVLEEGVSGVASVAIVVEGGRQAQRDARLLRSKVQQCMVVVGGMRIVWRVSTAEGNAARTPRQREAFAPGTGQPPGTHLAEVTGLQEVPDLLVVDLQEGHSERERAGGLLLSFFEEVVHHARQHSFVIRAQRLALEAHRVRLASTLHMAGVVCTGERPGGVSSVEANVGAVMKQQHGKGPPRRLTVWP